jgi:hypothetical protein
MSAISEILQETFNSVVELQTNICERKFTSVVIPKEVKNVGNYAFAGCEDLTKVDFSSKPNSIADTAFLNCQNLAKINAPWCMGGIPGAPWGAENAVINYLPTAKDISVTIARAGTTDIVAPFGHNSSANAYIEHRYVGDGLYTDIFNIEADSPVLYIYTEISNESGFYDNFVKVNLVPMGSTGKYFYSSEIIYSSTFEQTRNHIFNRPDVYPIEYFILYNGDNSGYEANLLGGVLAATAEIETVGYTYTYNVSLLGNLPSEKVDVRLTYKPDGTYVEGLMSNTCSESFEVACYDMQAINDEDILSLSDSSLIKNNFLKFAYEKAYLSREGANFDSAIEGVFEITY